MPAVALALACLWSAGLLLHDNQRASSPVRRGARRHRWYALPLLAAAGLAGASALGSWAMLVASCGAVGVWVALEGREGRHRYTSTCLVSLAISLPLPGNAGPLLASFLAAQMYLVAGIRKLRSPQFMAGRVLRDNLAYGVHQAGGGNHEFLPLIAPVRFATLLQGRTLPRACRTASISAALAELVVGLGALGLFPTRFTLGLGVLIHLAFLLVSPARIVPFSAASLGLLWLATNHPLVA